MISKFVINYNNEYLLTIPGLSVSGESLAVTVMNHEPLQFSGDHSVILSFLLVGK